MQCFSDEFFLWQGVAGKVVRGMFVDRLGTVCCRSGHVRAQVRANALNPSRVWRGQELFRQGAGMFRRRS